jgi:sRNA-binding carbon storage regulator CsrA
MLIISRSSGSRIYIGDSCVVQFDRVLRDGTALLRVWYRGRETSLAAPERRDVLLPCGGHLTVWRDDDRGRPTAKVAKVGVTVPRSVRVMRGEMLTPEERQAVWEAAGFPLGSIEA